MVAGPAAGPTVAEGSFADLDARVRVRAGCVNGWADVCVVRVFCLTAPVWAVDGKLGQAGYGAATGRRLGQDLLLIPLPPCCDRGRVAHCRLVEAGFWPFGGPAGDEHARELGAEVEACASVWAGEISD